ncbi:IS4 family transposase [Paenibacillus oralis]|uniref:IS4 family transposase n=1 Tax=Paenibacillus oralis TaxID=2490856 RepID=A0A3P3U2L9_9BACL|nr:IS4 family transposase [Paenibacillus oralis]RRJ64324.1 IS4 family transposase [Paenibacillus oralis]RRJ64354.1 IS4 family transposase [Paenibacillus oralis]RRJ66533.1 IS4 family transposase [Paenibacillus oralis]
MGNIHNLSLIRQCFSYFSDEKISFPIADYRVPKLTVMKCTKLIMTSQLAKWESYRQISRALRTSETLQESLELTSISASQISRKLPEIPTEWLESLFLDIMGKVKLLLPTATSKIGAVRIIDSTCIKLPANLAEWAHVNRTHTQIKIHVRVLALPTGQTLPEKAIPSTGNVSDVETVDLLVEDDSTIYVMDRGYIKYKQFDAWLKREVRFVNRINENNGVWHVEQELPIPSNTKITRDAIVRLGSAFRRTKQTLRLVEFRDEKDRKYRLVTSCFDLSATEIADIYRQRWLIELFFKWMKQHLRLVKLYSYEPQGVWNQIFLALITYAIAMHIQLSSGTSLSLWDVLQSVRNCWEKNLSIFEAELHRKPSRSSRGRQKVPKVQKSPPKLHTSVGIIKPRKTEGK